MTLCTVFGKAKEEEALQWVIHPLRVQSLRRVIVTRNYRCRWGEIDLIFEETYGDQTELVFLEIRSKNTKGWVSALESVTLKKRQRIQYTALHFLRDYRGVATHSRFDVLAWEKDHWVHVVHAWSA